MPFNCFWDGFRLQASEAPALAVRSIEKDHPFKINAQDNQDGTLPHERLAPAMIGSGFTDVQESEPAVSRKKSCASCASM